MTTKFILASIKKHIGYVHLLINQNEDQKLHIGEQRSRNMRKSLFPEEINHTKDVHYIMSLIQIIPNVS